MCRRETWKSRLGTMLMKDISRRNALVGSAALGLVALGLGSCSAASKASTGPDTKLAMMTSPHTPIRMVAFDGFPIFDPRPVLATVAQIGAGHGKAFVEVFKARLFQYQWLRALGGRYADFLQVAADALAYTGGHFGRAPTTAQQLQLRRTLSNLRAWPDVQAALTQLRGMNLRVAILSNMSPSMLRAGVDASGLTPLVDHIFSTDQRQTYKPDPRAYSIATEETGLTAEQILFVGFAGWDMAGATWFGFQTYWVNRLGAAPEHIGARIDGQSRGLDGLVQYAISRRQDRG